MKLKKVLASVLALCMVMSTMSFNVFAKETTAVAKVGDTYYDTLAEAMGKFNSRTVEVLCDVEEDIDGFWGVTLVTNVEGGVTITDTNTEDWIDFDDVTVGAGVTVEINLPFSGDSENVILGTLAAGETYYHGYDAKTTIKDGGKVTVSGTTILRYNETADAGLYIYGDGDDSTVEFDCDYYIGAYSGTFYAENANIEAGYYLLKNSYDNETYADVDLTLDNSSIEVVGTTDGQDSFIIDDKASVTLKNGSAIKDVRDFNILAGTDLTLDIDSESSIEATNISVAKDVPVETVDNGDGTFGVKTVIPVEVETYEELVAALAKDKSVVVMKNDITATATQDSGYGKAGIVVEAGDVLDGNGYKLEIWGADDTWDCAIAIKGGTVKGLTVAKAFRGIFMPGANGDVVIDNCKIDNVCYTFNSDDGSKEYGVTIKNTVLNGWTSFSDVHKFVTFENCTFGKGTGGYTYSFCRPYQPTTFTGCEFNKGFEFDAKPAGDNTLAFNDCKYDGEELSTGAGVEMFPDGGSIKIDDEESKLVADPVASVGLSTFATLEEAFAAAVDGDTITLLVDATPTLTSQRAITKASVIDLNGKTLTLTEDDLYFGTTTFKNGNIVVEPSVVASTAVFWMFENQTLTFDNVDITATGVTGTYLIGTWDNKEKDVNINILNGTNIIIDNDTVADLTAVICFNSTNSYVTIENSKIEVNNIDGRFYLGGTGSSVTIKNSTIDLDGVKEGFYLRAGEELDIAGTSNVDVKLNDTNGRYGINLTDATANYTVADTATVNASIYKAPAPDGSNLAKKVKLSFEATDKQEVYNIYAEAVDGTINRLSAVQVKFALDNSRMSYTLAPASELGVTLTNDLDDEEAYVFNFNGETAADATGAKLLIGTVTFGGYGNFNFTVDASFNNKIKTAQTTDNIVEEYVPTPDAANEKQGTFDIASSAITGAAVVEAKRDVKVVIDFNNDITAGNDADYNNMWVTLTGSNGEVHTAQVGDLVDVLDDEGNVIGQAPNYTAEKAEMEFTVTAGYRYTVVVKGEGYRTARYSTNVDASDDALVLTFWNNAKADENNNPVLAYIEDGEARSLKDVTFLAGDIAQDNIIDKYDLAAVVSYFGFDNLKTTNPNYVKYDLNRDGKIDADDISYVLVSWGK